MTPFLLWFVARFKKAVKKATHEVRNDQSDIVARGAAGPRIHARGQGVRAAGHSRRGGSGGQPGDRAGRAQGPAREVAPLAHRGRVTVSFCTAFVLWRGASLILAAR